MVEKGDVVYVASASDGKNVVFTNKEKAKAYEEKQNDNAVEVVIKKVKVK